MGTWFSIGKPPERVIKQDASLKRISRFHVKVREPKTIIFLDDVVSLDKVFVCFEHNPTIQGQYYHYFTCSNTEDCYLCAKGCRAVQTYFLTVVEQDRQDPNKWYKALFAIKRTAQGNFPVWAKLEKKINIHKLTTLKYAKFLVDRYDVKEAAIGSEFDYLGSGLSEVSQFVNPDLKEPFNYEVILQPQPAEFFKNLENQVPVEYNRANTIKKSKVSETIAIQY